MPQNDGNTPATPHSAFISHSSVDSALAGQLCERLEALRIRCWIAPRDITPGHPYTDEIVQGIKGCQTLVLLATSAAISSENVLNEVEQAHKHHRAIFTVMIKKPRVSPQLDYYIARLHWIESAGSSMNDVADRLSEVMRGRVKWEKVASPPSLQRSMVHWLGAFVGTTVAIFVLLAISGTAIWFGVRKIRQELSRDYRSLGWVTLSAAGSVPATDVQARIWLGDEKRHFSDVGLVGVARNQGAGRVEFNLTGKLDSNQAVAQETIEFQLPQGTDDFTTCLSMPSGGLKENYRVTQEFRVSTRAGGVSIDSAGEARVSKEDGSVCAAKL